MSTVIYSLIAVLTCTGHLVSRQSAWDSTQVAIKPLTLATEMVIVCLVIDNPFGPELSIPVNETAVIRWDYGDATLGTCQETVEGGNHFRYWIQNGPSADSGAIFMAASYEMPIAGVSKR